jgi:hypothetical protein
MARAERFSAGCREFFSGLPDVVGLIVIAAVWLPSTFFLEWNACI